MKESVKGNRKGKKESNRSERECKRKSEREKKRVKESRSVTEYNGKLAWGVPAAQIYYPSRFLDIQTFIQFIKQKNNIIKNKRTSASLVGFNY